MPVQRFTYVPDEFEAVEWDGTNLEEIRDFVGADRVLSSCSGLLSVRVASDEIVVVLVGWSVSVRAGEVTVSSGRCRTRNWVPV
jgi:hypothetical protein